jgi:hypothetical protein
MSNLFLPDDQFETSNPAKAAIEITAMKIIYLNMLHNFLSAKLSILMQ